MFFVILQNPFSLRGLRVKNVADLAKSRCDFLILKNYYFFSGVMQIKFEV